MKKIKLNLIMSFFILNAFFCFGADEQKKAFENDYLYSEAYFDYLIECAQEEKNKSDEKEKNEEQLDSREVTMDEADEEEIVQEYEPFKLRIEENSSVSRYGETFKKVDSKTIIPVGSNFSFIQDTSKYRNKYNSNDYKVLAGAEYSLGKYLTLTSGFETNYRDIDQIPTSRKLYFTPKLYITDKLSLSFHNKMNIQNKSTDHDIGVTLSPFKSKCADFGVYAGYTRQQNGTFSQSINFSSNFYLF